MLLQVNWWMLRLRGYQMATEKQEETGIHCERRRQKLKRYSAVTRLDASTSIAL